jgi:hypothetical protein
LIDLARMIYHKDQRRPCLVLRCGYAGYVDPERPNPGGIAMGSRLRRECFRLGLLPLALLALFASAAGATPPAAATLVAPSGMVISGTSLTFTWQAADAATFYYLQVNDATASPKLTLWYPAGMACPAGSGTCSVTLSTGFGAGNAVWWIQTWNSDGYGPWSAGMRFVVNYLPGAWSQSLSAADRFQLVLGGAAVLDRETGLVWERTPSTAGVDWTTAVVDCWLLPGPGRYGWRLPTMEELASLWDLTQKNPALPVGHPFSIGNTYYWSASTAPYQLTIALGVHFGLGEYFSSGKSGAGSVRKWCVRGGPTPQGPQ